MGFSFIVMVIVTTTQGAVQNEKMRAVATCMNKT